MYILKNGKPYEPVPEYTQQRIIIAIDSSKTNSCMTVANEYGVRLDDFELRGEPKDDVLQQCIWERQCLSVILEHSTPWIVGIEDIITKKEYTSSDGKKVSKFSAGLEIHQSRFKITAVFMSFVIFFQDKFDITPELVNNWSWKSTVLPEEYRTREHNKGSLDWHRDRGTRLANRTDDVTDCDCILEYLKITHKITGEQHISDVAESTTHKYFLIICSAKSDTGGSVKFSDNNKIKFEDKIAYMLNRLEIKEVGCCLVETRSLTPQQIYTHCMGRFEKKEERVYICVRRLE